MDYLLDTNILVVYSRANRISHLLEDDLGLLTGSNNLIISAVTVGEINSIAIRNNWGIKRIARLETLLDSFLVANINVEEIILAYAEIDAYSQGKLPSKKVSFTSRNMGKNDLWIASTGAVLGLELFTTDKDFNHLDGEYLKVRRIDMADYIS